MTASLLQDATVVFEVKDDLAKLRALLQTREVKTDACLAMQGWP